MHFIKAIASIFIVVGVGSASFVGDVLFVSFAGGPGACGFVNSNDDLVVALSIPQYGDGSNCFRNIRVNFNGSTVGAMVVDECPGCGGNNIALSPLAFSFLANIDEGRLHNATWDFIS